MAISVEQKEKLVRSHGYVLLPRDPLIKPEHQGSWMIRDLNESDPDSWQIVGDAKAELLDDAIEFHGMTYYMHGEWEHIFKDDPHSKACRALLDTVDQVVVKAEVQLSGKWKRVSKEGLEDLLESMNNNDVWSDPDINEEMERSNEVPEWA
jgi:hypothetical protein